MCLRIQALFIVMLAVLMIAGCSSRRTYPPHYQGDYSEFKPMPEQKIRDSEAVHRATMRPYTVLGKKYYPTRINVGETFEGVASWYGPNFHGKHTSNGEIFDMYQQTAAHKTWPMNTMVRVTNKNNGKSTIVRINDRGPFVGTRVIDLSRAAAQSVGMIGTGTAPVVLEILGFHGQVGVAPRTGTPSTPKPTVQQSVQMRDFAVQIGAFRAREGAERFRRKHDNAEGRYKSVIKSFDADIGRLYRVYITGFRSEDEARDFIERSAFIGATVVTE